MVFQECMYLHDLGDGAASFTKEEMQGGKHQEYEKQLLDALTPLPLPVVSIFNGQQSPVLAPPAVLQARQQQQPWSPLLSSRYNVSQIVKKNNFL